MPIHKKGIAFGVFDVFHKGHEYFLSQAQNRCDELIVVVTLSEIAEQMKKKNPRQTLEERMAQITGFSKNFIVISGDSVMGEWNVLKIHKPDIVFLGYDQQGIAKELDRLGIRYEYIDSYYPEKYKSSRVA